VIDALHRALPPGTICPKRREAPAGTFSEAKPFDPQIRAASVVGDDEIAALSDYPFISGHFSLPTLLRITSASAIATVLREPRARVLSHYAFWRLLSPTVRDAWRPYSAVDHALRPFDEFIAEPRAAEETDNLVCRRLLGDHARIPNFGFIADSDIDTVAEDAVGELETLGYVGVLELNDSMWEGLSGFFGVPLAPTWVNATESDSGTADALAADDMVTPDTLDALDARTAADAIVYRHVLLKHGYSAEYIERFEATAFLGELVRITNLTGSSATEARIRGRRSEELSRRLLATGAELQQTRQELEETSEQLRLHRLWLDGVQGSASWRMTEPLRAGKRTFRRLQSSASRRVARRADSEA
jgi:hypothetical protein